MRLQYKIQLAIDGIEDGTPGGMTTVQRLDAIRRRREAWRSLQFDFKRFITVEGDRAHAFSGSHFAWVDLNGHIRVLQVPSTIKGIPEKSWAVKAEGLDFEQSVDMTIDADQDLLVVVVNRYVS